MGRIISTDRERRGLTLIGLTGVVAIIAILAACGVPRFLRAVERSRAAEAFSFLDAVRIAQEHYNARAGTYAGTLSALDLTRATPRHFATGALRPGVSGDFEDSWSLTMTRAGSSAFYAAYTVTFTQEGFDRQESTIDRFPAIKPAGSGLGGGGGG